MLCSDGQSKGKRRGKREGSHVATDRACVAAVCTEWHICLYIFRNAIVNAASRSIRLQVSYPAPTLMWYIRLAKYRLSDGSQGRAVTFRRDVGFCGHTKKDCQLSGGTEQMPGEHTGALLAPCCMLVMRGAYTENQRREMSIEVAARTSIRA